MMAVTVEIDKAAIDKMNSVLDSVRLVLPRRLGKEVQHAAVYICNSLKPRTKVAPKNIRSRPGEYIAVPSPDPPRYVHSNSSHHKLLRRWSLTRKRGTPAEYTKNYFVYTKAKRKKGKMVGKSVSQERRELLRLHGGIARAGLAKKSWGWLAHDILKGSSSDILWRRKRGEKRNPRDYVKGLFQQSPDGGSAVMRNRLDYILSACSEADISNAIMAAAKRLEYVLEPMIEKAIASSSPWAKYGLLSDYISYRKERAKINK